MKKVGVVLTALLIFSCPVFCRAEIGKTIAELENSGWMSYLSSYGVEKKTRTLYTGAKSFSIESKHFGVLSDYILDNNDKIKEQELVICVKRDTPGLQNALLELVPRFVKEATGSQLLESEFMPLVEEAIKNGKLARFVKEFFFQIEYMKLDTKISKDQVEKAEVLSFSIKKR